MFLKVRLLFQISLILMPYDKAMDSRDTPTVLCILQGYYKHNFQTPIPTLLRRLTPREDANIGLEVWI